MKDGVESLGRVRAQALVLLAIAFLAGAFVGGTLDRLIGRPPRPGIGGPRGSYARGGTGAARAPRAPGALPSSYEALGLSADQRSKIEAILAKRSARVDSAMKSVCVVVLPARDSTAREIDAVLTSDQRVKRDSIRAARPGMRGGGRGALGCGPIPSAGAGKK